MYMSDLEVLAKPNNIHRINKSTFPFALIRRVDSKQQLYVWETSTFVQKQQHLPIFLSEAEENWCYCLFWLFFFWLFLSPILCRLLCRFSLFRSSYIIRTISLRLVYLAKSIVFNTLFARQENHRNFPRKSVDASFSMHALNAQQHPTLNQMRTHSMKMLSNACLCTRRDCI